MLLYVILYETKIIIKFQKNFVLHIFVWQKSLQVVRNFDKYNTNAIAKCLYSYSTNLLAIIRILIITILWWLLSCWSSRSSSSGSGSGSGILKKYKRKEEKKLCSFSHPLFFFYYFFLTSVCLNITRKKSFLQKTNRKSIRNTRKHPRRQTNQKETPTNKTEKKSKRIGSKMGDICLNSANNV